MPFEIQLALRYMSSKRKDAFVSLITLISIAGIALGVAALIVVLSVMNGFENDLKSKILGTNAHLVVLRSGGGMAAYESVQQQIRQDYSEDVLGSTPFIYNQGMLTSQSNVLGAVIRGIDIESVTQVTEIQSYLLRGQLGDLEQNNSEVIHEVDHLAATEFTAAVGTAEDSFDGPAIALGKELAFNLGLGIGDKVNLVSPTGEITPFGNAPRIRPFEVRVLFETGMYEYDSSLAYITLAEAQDFFGMNEVVTGIELKLVDPGNSHIISSQIGADLGFPYYTRDWKDLNKNLFGALQLEKIAMSIILILIILVAAFNIVSSLFMIVLEKARDIAILKSMGASRRSMYSLFVFEGFVIGAIGAILGLVLGLVLVYLLDRYQFIQLPRDIYYIDKLPVQIVAWEVAAIVLGAMVISVLATLYPASRAARIDPAEGIRYGAE